MHPESGLFQNDVQATLPEYIVYGTLQRSTRGDTTYMNCLTVVDGSWLAFVDGGTLVQWGAPLMSPAPSYDPERDSVMCYSVPTYGSHKWPLPAVQRRLVDATRHADNRNASSGSSTIDQILPFRWFGRLLLEGQILPELRSCFAKSKLKDSPSSLTQATPTQRGAALTNRLAGEGVLTLASLLEVLSRKNDFLSEELKSFVVTEYRKDFRRVWEQVLSRAVSVRGKMVIGSMNSSDKDKKGKKNIKRKL